MQAMASKEFFSLGCLSRRGPKFEMKTLAVLMLLASTLFGQSLEKKLAQYEESKLDKADALALSLFCPGAGLVYAGDNLGGLSSFAANLYLGYDFFNALDKRDWGRLRTISILMTIARALDIGFSLKAVDSYNRELRANIGLAFLTKSLRPELNLSITLQL
jgi:hypothetical protein